MLVVFVIVLVVFGPQKLPELARGLGKILAEFRKASSDFRGAFEEEMKDLERQAREVERKKSADAAAASAAAAPSQPATIGTAADIETSSPDGEISAPVDTRATEAMVITPVVEAVPRSATDIADGVVAEAGDARKEMPKEVPNEIAAPPIATDVPHDQQPA